MLKTIHARTSIAGDQHDPSQTPYKSYIQNGRFPGGGRFRLRLCKKGHTDQTQRSCIHSVFQGQPFWVCRWFQVSEHSHNLEPGTLQRPGNFLFDIDLFR